MAAAAGSRKHVGKRAVLGGRVVCWGTFFLSLPPSLEQRSTSEKLWQIQIFNALYPHVPM